MSSRLSCLVTSCHLLARALVAHNELEVVRHDRQVGHPPALELRVICLGFGQLHEVPHRPGDHVLRTLQPALLLSGTAPSVRAPSPAPRRASRRSRVFSAWRQRSDWGRRGIVAGTREAPGAVLQPPIGARGLVPQKTCVPSIPISVHEHEVQHHRLGSRRAYANRPAAGVVAVVARHEHDRRSHRTFP